MNCLTKKRVQQRNEKWLTQEVKFESTKHGFTDAIADHGNVDTATPQETLHLQPEELSRVELTDSNEDSD